MYMIPSAKIQTSDCVAKEVTNGLKATNTDNPIPMNVNVSKLLWSRSLRKDEMVPSIAQNHTKANKPQPQAP